MPFRFGRVPNLWMPGTFGSLLRPSAEVEVSAETSRWKRKALQYQLTCDRLKTALQRTETRYRELHARHEARRRSGLNHDVLRQLLPIRAAQLPLPARERQEAAARDVNLQKRSHEYLQAVSGSSARTPLGRVEIDGLTWWVPVEDERAELGERLRRQGFPYRAILQTREVAIGGVMIDIGANIGRTSIPRILLGDVRAVYAAEPEPANYACLVRNVLEHNLRGLVLPDRVAIGAVRCEARLLRSRHPGGHRVLHAGEGSADTITVQVWPLDDWITQLGIDAAALTFVKVDSQGSELDVLRGARDLLGRRHVSWQIEIDPELLRRRCASITELLELLRSRFSHFIDIAPPEPGPRVRPTAELAESLGYLGTSRKKTDIVFFHAL